MVLRTGSQESVRAYSSRLGCGLKPEPASVQHRSSGNVWWYVTGEADRTRCQLHCWRDSNATCCCQLGHRDLEHNRLGRHQNHRPSCWIRPSPAVDDFVPSHIQLLGFGRIDPKSTWAHPWSRTLDRSTYEQAEIKSIQLHDSIVMASPWDSISYITLHYNQISSTVLSRRSIYLYERVHLEALMPKDGDDLDRVGDEEDRPRTEPCGTPEVTGTVFEVTPLYRTNWLPLDPLNDQSPIP